MTTNPTGGILPPTRIDKHRQLLDQINEHHNPRPHHHGGTICQGPTAVPNAPARVVGVELTCDDCQQPYDVWYADNDVWNLVMGGPHALGDPGGMICPRCFTIRAAVTYSEAAIWHLVLDNPENVGPQAQITDPREAQPCPECANGKCRNCTGVVPEGDDFDHLVPCPCAEAGHAS
jgi:hypothetical protein